MGFFKRKNEKNVTRDNDFLQSYATKTQGLLMYAEESEAITNELLKMVDDFKYTAPSYSPAAKELEKKIMKDHERLTNMLEQPDCVESEIIMTIRAIRRAINDISALG